MSIPTDQSLYNRVKTKIIKKMPENSAYRSGHIVKKYNEEFFKIYGPKVSPWLNDNFKHLPPLRRWFMEKWTNQRGNVGYEKFGDIYRPQFRITEETPKTFSELTQSQINRAKREKALRGRVNRF